MLYGIEEGKDLAPKIVGGRGGWDGKRKISELEKWAEKLEVR